MEPAEKNLVRAVVRPLELSERSDSPGPSVQGDKRPGRKTPPAGDVVKLRAVPVAAVDQGLVAEAATWITAKVAATLKNGAQEVGEYLLEKFFANDQGLAKAKNPHKSASFRALAEKCGTPALPISKTWLNNAVNVALIIRRLPEHSAVFKALPSSYQEALLPLGDPVKVERLAKHAMARELSFRELRQAVFEERAKLPKGESRGRPRMPMVVTTLASSLKLFTFPGGKRLFTKADVEELDDEQRKDALESAERIIEKLRDLVGKLKEG